ncbi:amidohydrolase [Colletotrichum camelliae]|nr:amidohydrolase [Colletotrichum camelliae]
MTKIVIQNVRVFDCEAILEPSDVVITRSAGDIQDYMDDGSAAETSDIVVDGRGCTLIPGLIDVYANIKGAHAALGTFASHGVTSVIDMSSNTQQCQALRIYAAGRTRLPTVFTSGTGAVLAQDPQPRIYDNQDEVVIRTTEEAVAFAAARASGPDRADFVKVVVDIHSPNDALLKTIVDAAHAHGKLTVARTTGKASYERAMRASFDVFAHAPLDAPLDPALAREMAAQGKVFVPTLKMMRRRAPGGDDGEARRPFRPPGFPIPGLSGRSGGKNNNNSSSSSSRNNASSAADTGSRQHSNPGATSESNYKNAAASVRTLYEGGVTICAGTTANLVPGTQIPFGESLHEELELLVDAGMSRLDVLRSATCVAATAFRLHDRGIVRSGLRADLLLVDGNPLEDITATRKIKRAWIQGEDVEPARTH